MIHLYQNPGVLQRNNAQHGNVQNAHTITAIQLLPQLCFCRNYVFAATMFLPQPCYDPARCSRRTADHAALNNSLLADAQNRQQISVRMASPPCISRIFGLLVMLPYSATRMMYAMRTISAVLLANR